MPFDKNGVYVLYPDQGAANPDGSITYPSVGGQVITSFPDGHSTVAAGNVVTVRGPVDQSSGSSLGPVVSTTNTTTGNAATAGDVQAVNDANGSIDWGDAVANGIIGIKDFADSGNLIGHPFINNGKVNSMIHGAVANTIDGRGPMAGNNGSGVVNVPGIGDVGSGDSGTGGSGSGGSGSGGGVVDAVNGVANEAFKYAAENRDFQLQGLDRANAALDPAKASYASMYGPGGTLAGPGQGEQAFTDVGRNLLAPTAQSQALAAASPFLSGQSPGMGAFKQVAGQLSGPTLSSQTYGQYADQLGQQSAGEQRYADTAARYDTNALSQAAPGFQNALAQQSAGEQRYAATQARYDTNALSQAAPGFQAQLAKTSAGEQRYADTASKYNDNALNQAASGFNAKLNAPTNLESSLGSIAGKYAAPSDASKTFQSQYGQLAGPGALEQFAASDLAGTNPYYRQLQAQQSADIDASMAARGGFNSGAAMKAQSLAASNLSAQQYQQEAQLQGQAQAAMQSRLGQQQAAAGDATAATYAGLAGQTSTLSAADAQRLARTQSGIDMTTQQAAANLGYLNSGQQAANSAGAASLARTQAGIGLADQQASADLGYLTAGQAAANAASAQSLARTHEGIGLASQQASTDLGYLQGGQQAANAASAQSLARTQAGIDLTRGTDATNLAQNLGYVNAANSAGAGQVSQYSAYGQMAAGQDAATQAQNMNYLSSAAAAQKASQDRQQQGFTNALATGAIESANTTGQYGKAGDNYASMVGAGMGAQLNAAQLAAQQQMNQQNNQYGLYGTIIKGVLS